MPDQYPPPSGNPTSTGTTPMPTYVAVPAKTHAAGRVIALLGCIALVAAFFLPIASASGDQYANLRLLTGLGRASGITSTDFANLSLFGIAQFFFDMIGLNYSGDYAAVAPEDWLALAFFAAPAICSFACLLFALVRRATPLLIFWLLDLAVCLYYIPLCFENVPASEWGPVPWAYIIGFAVTLLGTLVLFVERHSEKKAWRKLRQAGLPA